MNGNLLWKFIKITICLIFLGSVDRVATDFVMAQSQQDIPPLIENNIIVYNSASKGGGIALYNSSLIARNNIIVQNTSSDNDSGGGGIYIFGTLSNPVLTGNTISKNIASSGKGGGIYAKDGQAIIKNSILWENQDDLWNCTATYSNITDLAAHPGVGNISVDPKFVQITNPFAAGYYRLSENSACINAGEPTYAFNIEEKDIDGEIRVTGGRIDLGADEATDTTSPDTQIYSGPEEGTTICENSITFRYTGADDSTPTSYLKYAWRIDGQIWSEYSVETNQTLSNLAIGPHTFEVRAKDLSGNVDDTPAIRHFIVDLNPPSISNVTTLVVGNQVTISWITDKKATSQVEYGFSDSYGMMSPLYSQLVTSHSATIAGLMPNTTYHFRVKSRDFCGRETISPNSSFVILPDTRPPETTIVEGPADNSVINISEVKFVWTGSDDITPVGSLTYSYKLDSENWSDFSSSTSVVLSGLTDGNHTFYVMARDSTGNEDPTPSTRNFTIDTTPPSPASNFKAGATYTGVKLDWNHSPSPDINSYRLYWDNGTGVINYSVPFATIYYPLNSFIVSIQKEGTYKFGLRAVDRAGNEEKNNNVIASVSISGFNVTVTPESTIYDRGQDVPIAGTVTTMSGSPIVNIPVTIDIESRGFHRYYTVYSNNSGEFRYTFQPRSNEAGLYTVSARVMYEGVEKIASASFRILGLLMEPANVTLDMSMNSTKTINFNLRNIGDIPLTGIEYSLVDNNPNDIIKGSINISGLPSILNPGSSVVIPVIITADPGNPPGTPAVFNVNINSVEGSRESSIINTYLHEAVSLPMVTPDPLKVGVRMGEPVTKVATVTNQGFAPMTNTLITIHDPNNYNWITIINGNLGLIHPLESKTCQIHINPPSDIMLGTYVVQLDIFYNGIVKPIYLTVEITTVTTGQVAFKVYDDTGSVVSGAEVNLISKAFYANVTPQGRQEYNNIIKGTTNAEGYVLFTDVPLGEYRYLINAVRHDSYENVVTIEPGTTPKNLEVILVTNLVNVEFSVTPTTIQDQYSVTLNITYTTNLTKPTLYVNPSSINLSFFPEEIYQGTISIRNTSNNAPVRDILVSAAGLDPIDNEVKIVFDNGTPDGSSTITIAELGPKETVSISFKAVMPVPNAKLNNRNLGNITATGKYTLSIEGTAWESTTSTPIPVLFWKPQELILPSISYINDETDGNLNDLEYQGTSYRLSIKSNRNVIFSNYGPLKAITHIYGGPDNKSIIEKNDYLWEKNFNQSEPLISKGDTATFDIDGLKEVLEDLLINNRTIFLSKPNYLGFFGQWEDRTIPDAYLIPISITTIRQNEIISSSTGASFGWSAGGTIPSVPLNEHGEVKIQIDQKVSLEREAFNAKLKLKPTVPALENVSIRLNIKDTSGNDASQSFFVVVTGKSGIDSKGGGSISGPAEVNWQIIPSSEAGGAQSEGLNYNISATIDYSYEGTTFSYTTRSEMITIKPMPKLVLDYYLPYVVMAGKPLKIKVKVTNQGAGPARNLVISSAQPKILENVNNIPISFTINGSSSRPDRGGFREGVLAINFGDVSPGGVAEGYWEITTIKDGYFVEFASTLKHENYLGIQLDPLIVAVNTHFVAAIGGYIFQTEGCTATSLLVQVWQGDVLKGQDTASDTTGAYFISDLQPGDYIWAIRDSTGMATLAARNITVLADQPTSHIDGNADTYLIDSDNDGLSDCWEIRYFGNLNQNPNDDPDGDGLTNLQEYQLGTDPRNSDTDGDGFSDKDEIDAGMDPRNSNSFPGATKMKTLENSINNMVVTTYNYLQGIKEMILKNFLNSAYFMRSVEEQARETVFDFISNLFSLLILGSKDIGTYIHLKHCSPLSISSTINLTEKYPELIQILDKVGGLENLSKAIAILTQEEIKLLVKVVFKEIFIKIGSEEGQSSLEELDSLLNEQINSDMESLNALKAEALRELAKLTPEEMDLFISEIRALNLGNVFMESIYSEKSLMIDTIVDIKKENEEDWKLKAAKILWAGSTSLLSWTAALATGGVLLPGIITSVEGARQLFFDYSQLKIDAQMSALAYEALSEGFTVGNTIYLNSFEALKNIRDRNTPCIPKGTLSIANKKVDKIFKEDTAQSTAVWMGKEFISNILMKREDECYENSNYFVIVLYKRPYNAFTLLPIIAERTYDNLIPVQKKIDIVSNMETNLHFPAEEPPEEGKYITFYLFANTGNKLYGLTELLMPWDPIVEHREEGRESFSLFIISGLNEGRYDSFSLYYNTESGMIEQKPTQVTKIDSPGDLRVYDSQGRLTGLVSGKIYEGIPRSIYDEKNKFIAILDATDKYVHEISGTGEGTYGLKTILANEKGVNKFIATEIPILIGVVHRYTINWDILSQGGEGVTIRVDSDGDGIFERTITSDNQLNGNEFVPIQVRVSGGAYFYPETPTYRASFSMDVTGPFSPSGWLKYYYTRTRMNFVSTAITSAYLSGDTVTISGTGTVNGVGGYTFTATVVNGSPDQFAIVIKKADGSTYYSAGPKIISGGDFTIQ